MNFNSIEELRKEGFEGFKTYNELFANFGSIPDAKGIYMVLYDKGKPEFLEKGTGGFFKDQNPNVSTDILREKWVNDTIVLYIRKVGGYNRSSTLRLELTQYLRFGAGYNIGHFSGRYVWQIQDRENLIFCWKIGEGDNVDLILEMNNIFSGFEKLHNGRFPFANIKTLYSLKGLGVTRRG